MFEKDGMFECAPDQTKQGKKAKGCGARKPMASYAFQVRIDLAGSERFTEPCAD
jgi:hypothetical protein